jgi:DNA/RNA endonuclease YhcR with UshA esterase domain
LNEFMPDPSADWNGNGVTGDEDDEYIELYNANDFAVDLEGWQVDDVVGGSTPYVLPVGAVIQPRAFLVLYSAQSKIALNNSGGDSVRLLRPDDVVVDDYTYTATRADEAYSRTSDGGGEWTHSYPPSPGAPNTPGDTPTPTPTAIPGATPTPTTTPTVTSTPLPVDVTGISLNEFLPDPASDWDGNGVADAQDEYIEVYNANDFAVDLGGWLLDDEDDGGGQRRFASPTGSPIYTIPLDTTIPARGFLIFYRSQTSVALNNDGDWVRLLRPDGAVVEQFEYSASRDDEAYSKTADGGSAWTRSYPPSPGMTNTSGGTPTPTATPTPPVTPTPLPTSVSLNEFMPDPASDWDGDGAASAEDEYIELYNAADVAVDLSGWLLDDEDDDLANQASNPEGTRPYVIPDGVTIGPRGFLVFYRSQTGVALNNDSDSVRLLGPDGRAVESYDYSSTRDDVSFSKTADGGNIWTTDFPPSPGAPNRPGYTPDDVIRLNEVLASPRDVDWDGDGQVNHLDEWIELVNAGDTTVQLGGWQLTDNPPSGVAAPQSATGHLFTLPAGTTLQPGQYLVIFRAQSDLALNADEEWVRLLHPDGGQADALYYDRFSGYDHSRCRLPDGMGQWTVECTETPGQRNLAGSGGSDANGGGSSGSGPTYDRFNYSLISIAYARALPDGPRVTLEGQVTVLPDVLDDKEIYIQDATGGMLVYLRSGEWPPLTEGQWVRVNGWLDTHDGEKEIRLTRIDDVKTLGQAPSPPPLAVHTGDVGEATEGRLVVITAPASGYRGQSSIFLDDGSGEARVVIQESTGMERPYVVIGDVWTVVGVVSQNDEEPPYDSFYRVLPRRPADVQHGAVDWTGDDWAALNSPPLYLPVTGEADQAPPPAGVGPGWLWIAALVTLVLTGGSCAQRWRTRRTTA